MAWDEESAMLLAGELSEDVETLNQIVQFSIDKGIFNNSMYEKYKILTSRRIQENYYMVIKRRKSVNVRADFIIYKPLLTCCKHDVDIKEENADTMSTENQKMHTENDKVEESRVEESKVDKSRVENICKEHSSSSAKADPISNQSNKNNISNRIKDYFN